MGKSFYKFWPKSKRLIGNRLFDRHFETVQHFKIVLAEL